MTIRRIGGKTMNKKEINEYLNFKILTGYDLLGYGGLTDELKARTKGYILALEEVKGEIMKNSDKIENGMFPSKEDDAKLKERLK